jgi:hypothetical protein
VPQLDLPNLKQATARDARGHAEARHIGHHLLGRPPRKAVAVVLLVAMAGVRACCAVRVGGLAPLRIVTAVISIRV